MNKQERQERAAYAQQQKRVAAGMVAIAIVAFVFILLIGEPHVK